MRKPRDRMTASAAVAPVYQPGATAGNDEEAGYQPASPSRAIRTYLQVRERNTLMSKLPTTATAPSTPLTPEQVCDLPMGDLLAQVNVTLDTTEINEPGFFGYVTIQGSGRATIYLPSQASDLVRDIATRFLITTRLGLPTDLFPDVLQATVIRDGEAQA